MNTSFVRGEEYLNVLSERSRSRSRRSGFESMYLGEKMIPSQKKRKMSKWAAGWRAAETTTSSAADRIPETGPTYTSYTYLCMYVLLFKKLNFSVAQGHKRSLN